MIYSIATGLCGLAWSFESLLVFRFLVGFGLGGQLPVAVTLMTEYSPPDKRGRFIVLLESFWGLGWLAAALVAYLVIPQYGWQMAFAIGALPALYVFQVWRGVPESVRYLVDKGRAAEAHGLVCKLEAAAGLAPGETAILPPKLKQRAASFADLWKNGCARRTLMLWLLWFGIVYSYYGIFTWLPSLLVGQGYTVLKSFEAVLLMTLAQLPGYFAAAYLVDRIGRKITLAGFLAACAACAYFFGQGNSSSELLFWGSLMSFFNLGAWGVVYTYTPELYPTGIRALGSGWAAAVGRIGGIIAPTAVGYMLTADGGFARIFAMFTAVMLGVAIVVAILGEETKGRTLGEINRG